MLLTRRTIPLLILLLCWDIASSGARQPIPVGAAKIDITPERPIRLSGYGSRKTPAEGVAGRLHAKALAIGSDENLSVLVTLDAIGIPAWVTNDLADRLNRQVGLARSQLAVSATHSHAAPALAKNLPFMFLSGTTGAEEAEIQRYTLLLLDKLETVALAAVEARKAGSLDWTKGKLSFAANRRVLKSGTWSGFGEQADGPVDHTMPLLRVTDAQGQLVAVVANYACHCTTMGGDFNQIHGDWAGVAQAEIERRHPNTIAMIAIGCGADQNPSPRGTLEMAVASGRALADEVDRLLAQNQFANIESAPRGTYREIQLPLETPPAREVFEKQVVDGARQALFAKAMLEKLDRGESLDTDVTYPVQTWTFGDDLAMIFLGGEVVVDYAKRFYREYDSSRVWVNAYCNDVPCYIPSKRLYSEGGYEVDGSMLYYGKPSRLDVDTEDRVAGEVMRQLPHEFYSDSTRAFLPDSVDKDQALKTIRVADGFRVELIAAEPLVNDPIDIAWGPDGKLWVVEMADYPLGVDGKRGGRVRYLEDRDHDGQYDASTLFLDGLPYPNAVMPWRDGAMVVTASQILLARDTDKDGKADRREVLLQGFESGNPQHQLAGLTWGLDNQIHIANGVSHGAVTSVKNGQTLDLGSRDLRFHPPSGQMDPQSGKTQFGLSRDAWGNWFGCSNSNPWWHYALADHYLRRNPHVAFPNPKRPLGLGITAPPVFPASHTVSRFNDYDAANRFTSACSVTPYRDRILGEVESRCLFVAEPVHNLVSRIALEPEGSTFRGGRVESETASEFFASTDNWCRPTSIRTGPDGALYVVDMYRQTIEHPEWIPDRWQWRLHLRAGSDKGRIYRITRDGVHLREPNVNLATATIDECVKALDTENGTTRDLVHMQLLWREDDAASEALKSLVTVARVPEARVQALAILDGMNAIDAKTLLSALADPHPQVRKIAIRLAEPMLKAHEQPISDAIFRLVSDADAAVRQQLAYSLGETDSAAAGNALAQLARESAEDPYLRAAILSSAVPHRSALLTLLDDGLESVPDDFRRNLIQTIVAEATPQAAAELLGSIAGSTAGDATRWRTLSSTLATLTRRGISLSSLEASSDLRFVDEAIDRARQRATDSAASESERLAAVLLLGTRQASRAQDVKRLIDLMHVQQPPDLQRQAVVRCEQLGSPAIAKAILQRWDTLGAAAQSTALAAMVRRDSWVSTLLDAAESEPTFAAKISPSQRASLTNHRQHGQRARSLLALTGDSDRQERLKSFAAAFDLNGDPEVGSKHFAKLCASCHRLGDVGNHVGPDLMALSNKSSEALLRAIVDPNQAIEEKYTMYVVITDDGRSVSGIVESETGTAITLIDAEGKKQTVLRNELEQIAHTGVSLMPENLDVNLDPQAMADLIAFLQGKISGRSLATESDGSLRLSPADVISEGPSARFDPRLSAISWIGPEDTLTWKIKTLPAGRYAIFFNAGIQASPDTNPSAFEMRLGDKTVHGVIEHTGRLTSMRRRQFAEVYLPGDVNESEIRFQHDVDDGLVSIREIAIIPMR